MSGLSGSVSAPCSATPPRTSVSRRGASVRLVTDSVQLPPRRHPWSPGSVGQGVSSSQAPWDCDNWKGSPWQTLLPGHYQDLRLKHTPVFLRRKPIQLEEWALVCKGTWTEAPKEWRLVDIVFALCLAPDHSISQRGAYTLLQNLAFCGYCRGTPVLFLALTSSRTFASRCHRTVTNSKEYLNSYHPQGAARGNRPRSSVFPGRDPLANPHSCSWRGF